MYTRFIQNDKIFQNYNIYVAHVLINITIIQSTLDSFNFYQKSNSISISQNESYNLKNFIRESLTNVPSLFFRVSTANVV